MLYFSDIIQHLLIDKKMNKKQTAEAAGLLSASFSRMINNPNNDYHISTLCDIIKALDCTLKIDIIDSESNKVLYTIKEDKQ